LIAAVAADVTMPIVSSVVLRETAIASAARRAREHEPEDGSQQAKAEDHANAGAKPNRHYGSSEKGDLTPCSSSVALSLPYYFVSCDAVHESGLTSAD
jgi:hypothetical protein